MIAFHIGDICSVNSNHDSFANEHLFYIEEIAGDRLVGYLEKDGKHTPYTCPAACVTRVARAILFRNRRVRYNEGTYE
jgi:hypothetical protein